MDVSLKLYFTTDLGKNTTLTIPYVNEGMNANAIRSTMINIIKDGLVKNKQGTLTGIVKARMYKVQTETIEI